jgi:hypothetical protein
MATAPLTVACGTCHTKFHVAAGLVRGKLIKFRCKRCKGAIEVDGTALPAEEAAPASVPFAATIPPPPPAGSTEPITFFGFSGRPSQVDLSQSMRLSISDGWEGALPPAETAPPAVPTVVLTDRVLRPPPVALVTPGTRGSRPASLDSPRPTSAIVPSARRSSSPTPFYEGSSSLRATAPLPSRSSVPAWVPASARPVPDHGGAYNSPTAPPTVIHQSSPARSTKAGGVSGITQWAGHHQRTMTAVAVAAAAFAVAVVTWRHPRGSADAHPAVAEPRNGNAHAFEDNAKPLPAPLPPSVDSATDAPSDTPALPSSRATSSRSGRGGTRGIGRAARSPRGAPPDAVDGDLSGNAASAAQAMADVMRERELDVGAARAALDDAAREASSCRGDDTSARFARFAITFAPSGRVASAEIEGGPLANTGVGACMLDAFRSAQVPAFTGAPATLHKNVSF